MPIDKSVSKFVREILNQDPSLVHELQQRTTAQREIAKKIKDQLIEELKFTDKDPIKLEGNVAVAITRYLKRLREQQEELLGVKKVQELLKKGTTEVTDGLKHYKVVFHENTDTFAVIKVILSQLDRGDISSVFVNTHGVELYVKKMAENPFLRDINDCKDVDPYKLQESLSLLKLILPRNAEEIPGILAHVSSLLADQAISLYDIMVHHSENLVIIFVINEQHASKARDILLKLNNDYQKN
jgi:aspartokinase